MGQLGELSPAASVAVGILVGLLSTSVQSVGLTLQRKSHLLEDSKEDDTHRRPPYRRRRWQLGMLMFVIANLVGSTIQITTLPLPVLSTLQASGLVFNTICATLLLGEPFTRWSFGGTALVAGGAVLIALFGALPEPSHTLDQLLALLVRPQFVAWMLCTVAAMAGILALALVLPRIHSRRHGHSHHGHSSHPHRLNPRLRLVLGLCFGGISAILSAHSLLVAKSAVELLIQTIAHHNNQFNRWQSWIILLALLTLALSQLYFLHRGLKIVSTSVLYPFVFCIYNIIAILDGLIYFHQMDRLPPLHAGLIAVGTVILLAGVLALSWRLGDEAHQDSMKSPGHYHVPAVGQENLLGPGMGMIDDTTESPTPASSYCTSAYATEDEDEDEESAVNGKANTEQTPLLGIKQDRGSRTSRSHPRSAREHNGAIRAKKARYRQSSSAGHDESDSIWNALMDVGYKETLERHTWGLHRGRRASTMTALSRPRDAAAAHSDGDDNDGDDEQRPAPQRRTRTVAVTDGRWRRTEDHGRSVSGPLPRSTTSERTRRRRAPSLGTWLGGLLGRGRSVGQEDGNVPVSNPRRGSGPDVEGDARGGEG